MKLRLLLTILVFALGAFVTSAQAAETNATSLQFEIGFDKELVASPQTGRLLLALSRKDKPEPRFTIGQAGAGAPFVLGRDITALAPDQTVVLDEHVCMFPVQRLSEIPAGDYFVQAVLSSNIDLRAPNSPGNLYSDVRKIHLDPAQGGTFPFTLDHRVPREAWPNDTDLVKFVRIRSALLSDFYGRPIYLRAGIILPAGYNSAPPSRKYPLWVRIGGWGARYTNVTSLMGKDADFRKTWMTDNAPQMILLQLDGAGPFGDPYQVNSANNGPYGNAITRELIPFVEQNYRCIGLPRARVLSGLSTGGWVSLALQIFYPDFFNGTWTFCPDPVDFRAFELVNIYEDENAYVNKSGDERASDRSLTGETRLTMRRELQSENVVGTGDSWTMSGGQWCTWNATYGPRGADGKPAVLWDPQTGKIDHKVADQWKKMDLRLILENNWKTLGPKLQGKLHISVGEADNYFLNNAVHLLDDFLSHADPPIKGRIVYGPGKGHGWMDVTTLQMMKEMEKGTGGPQDR